MSLIPVFVRVIEDDEIPTLACDRTADASCDHSPASFELPVIGGLSIALYQPQLEEIVTHPGTPMSRHSSLIAAQDDPSARIP
jgi:hypothetical protein